MECCCMAKKKEKKDSDMHTKNIKKQKNKKKHFIGVKEFAFNFISIVFALVVLFYFGGRCFYYYSLQRKKKKDTEMTLNGLIIQNNKLVQSGDGLYQDKTGYYFRGREINNYVWFANRMFRVLSVKSLYSYCIDIFYKSYAAGISYIEVVEYHLVLMRP